jgi:integrase
MALKKKRSAKWTWNKGLEVGQKDAFTPAQVKRIRHILADRGVRGLRNLALFSLAIDTMLQGPELLNLTVKDVAHANGTIRSIIEVARTRRKPPVRCTLSKETARALGPQDVLRYLARYTHRVAISNRRLIAFDDKGVTFKWKDYRIEGRDRYKVMTLATDEFIRRFLIHVLPDGFHRIRHYGLFANGSRADNIAQARKLLAVPTPKIKADQAADTIEPAALSHPCPCCGGRMIIIETFERGSTPRYRPTPATAIRIDTS